MFKLVVFTPAGIQVCTSSAPWLLGATGESSSLGDEAQALLLSTWAVTVLAETLDLGL